VNEKKGGEEMSKVFARLGDGFATEISEAELMKDIEDGTREASERAKIPPLSQDEIKHLFEICKNTLKMSGVEKGKEIVLSYDGGTNKIGRLGINTGRLQALQIYERCFGADTTELSQVDYSYKAVKPVIHEDMPVMEQAQLLMVVPVFYGAMPNLGLYTQPDGPVPNPAELLPKGKIKEAREAYGQAIEHAVRDMVYVGSAFYEGGADGINFDTVGASGDPDFKAALLAAEALKKKYPDICIEMGMAGEFVIGMHGELEHRGVRLAGLYPHDQVKIAQDSGVTIFGPAVTTATNKTIAWTLARAITFAKAAVKAARIPVHGNMGMGVGGLPVCETPPVDAVSLASRAMVEISRLDGL
jgi:dimethylamine--corrinoid protein Co-methyltransferase